MACFLLDFCSFIFRPIGNAIFCIDFDGCEALDSAAFAILSFFSFLF